MTTCEGQNFIETLWETIFSSSSQETPNRILPNLAHLLILCVFTSVLCRVNTKNQIQSWPFIYKPGEHRQQSKGKKHTQNYEPNEFERMRVKHFLSETVAIHPQY